MEKSLFLSKISSPKSFSLQEKLDIQAEKSHFPYCSLLQYLDLLSDKAANIYQWNERFQPKVSLYMINPDMLSEALKDVELTEVNTPEDLKLKQQIEETKRQEFSEDSSDGFDIMKEINSYQEVSHKTAPKSVILSDFLEVDDCKTSESDENSTQSIEDLGKKSISGENLLETETLAIILEKQGKFQKAIDIYEKLIVKNPEKSSIFAVRINELKNKIENK